MTLAPQPAILNQTTTSLTIIANPSYPAYRDVGRTLYSIEGALLWYWGDYLLAGENTNMPYTQVLADLGIPTNKMKKYQNAVFVCKAIPPAARREELSFYHHDAVAACHPDVRNELLQWAIDTKATVKAIWIERYIRAGTALPTSTSRTITGDRDFLYNELQADREYKLTIVEIDNVK